MAARKGKAGRIRERLFADRKRFEPSNGMYSSLPWCFRRVLWLFPPRTWQIYTYLVMRSGQEALTWHTDKQIAVDVDVTHRKVAPHLRELEKLGFIAIKEHDGERFIFLLDPVPALDALVRAGRIHGLRLEGLNEDLETIGLPTLPIQAAQTAAVSAESASPLPEPGHRSGVAPHLPQANQTV